MFWLALPNTACTPGFAGGGEPEPVPGELPGGQAEPPHPPRGSSPPAEPGRARLPR